MSLERKKKEMMLMKHRSVISELEYKIMEREEDINRMKKHRSMQLEEIAKIEEELKGLKE